MGEFVVAGEKKHGEETRGALGVLLAVSFFRAAHVRNRTEHLEFTDNRESVPAACADITDIDQC